MKIISGLIVSGEHIASAIFDTPTININYLDIEQDIKLPGVYIGYTKFINTCSDWFYSLIYVHPGGKVKKIETHLLEPCCKKGNKIHILLYEKIGYCKYIPNMIKLKNKILCNVKNAKNSRIKHIL